MQNRNKVKFFSPAKGKTGEHLRGLVVFKRKLTSKPSSVFHLHTYYSSLATR